MVGTDVNNDSNGSLDVCGGSDASVCTSGTLTIGPFSGFLGNYSDANVNVTGDFSGFLVNYGNLDIDAGDAWSCSSDSPSNSVNYGTLNVDGGSCEGSLYNLGVVNINSSGSCDVFSNGGTVNVGSGVPGDDSSCGAIGWNWGTVNIDDGSSCGNITSNGGTVNNSGTLLIPSYDSLSNAYSGTLNNSGTLLISSNGSLSNTYGGTLDNSGSLTIEENASLSGDNSSAVNNSGTLTADGPLSGNVNNCGTMLLNYSCNFSALTQSGGLLDVEAWRSDSSFTNTGGEISGPYASSLYQVTTLTVNSDGSPSTFGSGVTFTADVYITGTATFRGGTVDFYDNSAGKDLGQAALNSGPYACGPNCCYYVASLGASLYWVGDNSITATYSGDASNLGSSATTDQWVEQAGSSTSVYAYSAVFGQPVTLYAAVYANGDDPSGETIDFYDELTSQDLGQAELWGDTASLEISPLSLGDHQILATYYGDSCDQGSSGTTDCWVGQRPPSRLPRPRQIPRCLASR